METARLNIRKFRDSDFLHMRTLESDQEIMKFTPMRYPLTENETRERLNSVLAQTDSGIWAMERKQNSQFVGWIMLKIIDQNDPELGFMVVRDMWGNGYTYEAASALLNYGFGQLKYKSIKATVDQENGKSKYVLQKLGFEFEKCISRFDKKLEREISLEVFKKINPEVFQA
jgi:[ribosomal protein S5]-alanine N-acetyltransferase